MSFRIYCAVSLDGFIADHQGGVAWLDAFHDVDYGYTSFLASVNTVVMGRKSYELARSFGAWEYTGKRSIVLTTQTLTDLPPDVETTPGPVDMLARELRKNARGDVWIMGGGQVMGAFLDAGAVDDIELYVIPIALGRGVPLFSSAGQPAVLKLLDHHRFTNGVVRTRYMFVGHASTSSA